MSPAFLESIANDSRVFKYVTCEGVDRIELAGIWKDCVALEFDTGGFLFHRHEAGVYEVHTLFLPKSRNVDACADDALAYMFNTDATVIITQIAKDLPHVKRFALRHGFVKFAEGVWKRPGKVVDADYYELTKTDWKEFLKCR